MTRGVRQVMAILGRTEDIRFSPDNSRLAIAGYHANTCLVLDVKIDRSGERPVIGLTGYVELRSDQLKEPHGFDFIGNHVLVVANRAGSVAMFRLPRGRTDGLAADVDPFRVIDRVGDEPLQTPGSVCVTRADLLKIELLVCNTFFNRVTRHTVRRLQPARPAKGHVFLTATLDVPDGIAQSPDGRFVAISNHSRHEVTLFDRRDRADTPCGRLTGMDYPHGLRFTRDGRTLYVADAGQPEILRFEAAGCDWRGERRPAGRVTVLTHDVFTAGRYNDAEGGPKGIDITRDGNVIAITCEAQPFAFFQRTALLASERSDHR